MENGLKLNCSSVLQFSEKRVRQEKSLMVDSSFEDGMQVVMFDPGNFIPYYIDDLCNALSSRGVSIRLITSVPLFEHVELTGSYEVEYLFFQLLEGRIKNFQRKSPNFRRAVKALSYPAGLWRTWQELKSKPGGIFHVQWALLPLLDAELLKALRAKNWRIVYTIHDLLSESASLPSYLQLRRLLKQMDAVIVHTPGLAARLGADFGEVRDRLHVIPIPGTAFPLPTAAEKSHSRLLLGLPQDVPVLLFFGLIKPYKGLEYLLTALPEVLKEFPTAKLVVAGELMMPIGPLENLIDHLKIRDALDLRLVFIPQSEVAHYFHAADLVVAPYVEISASAVVRQAQGYGLPIVATRVGGLPEMILEGESGFLVPPCSSEAIAAAICQGLRNPPMLAKMGRRAYLNLKQNLTWDQIAQVTLELYQSILELHKR
jgi:D-inositol-3-phosphate glycosyltransferase